MHGHGCPGAATVSNYPDSHHRLHSVSALYIMEVLWSETIRVGEAILGFSLEDVTTHSLHSTGAMSMHITEVLDHTLMDVGRWGFLGFMVYIQQHIASFSMGI